MEFADSIKRNLTTSTYAQFGGRASRSEYWWFFLFAVLVNGFTSILDLIVGSEILGAALGMFSIASSLALAIPNVATTTRRLHDIGRSGWWQLILFTGIGVFLLLYWTTRRGDSRVNRYGQPPK
jgi:uncharacterized membrane protein YhaH (DUF805 family)